SNLMILMSPTKFVIFTEIFNKSTPIKYNDYAKLDLPSVKSFWSLAISNSIDNEVLVAISCFNEKDVMGRQDNSSIQADTDAEKGLDFITRIPPTTFVISARKNSRISTTVDNIGGVLHFLCNNPSDEFTELIIMNASGISKAKIFHKNNFQILTTGSFFNKQIISDEFHFPSNVAIKILKLYEETSCKSFLNSIIERNYFFAEDFKTNRIEMYNLKSCELEMTFQKREEIEEITSNTTIFAISKNNSLLAHCSGNKCITIYLMENGLEVTTKLLNSTNRILSISFINNDEQLFIIAEDEIGYHDDGTVKFASIIFIWDIFTYKNTLHKIENLENVFPTLQENTGHSIARSSENIISITENGKIFSIPHHPDIESSIEKSLDYHSKKLKTLSFENVIDRSSGKYHHYHTIYQLDGKCMTEHEGTLVNDDNIFRLDDKLATKTENKRSVVVNNKEPWVKYKRYQRTSAYLDEKKTTQLIIGETSVQLNSSKPETIKVHWPQKTHVLEDACEALKLLNRRKCEPVGPKNQNKFEGLVNDTENFIVHIIKTQPDVWRLSEVRFNLMANLIHGERAALIQHILFENNATNPNHSNRICRFLHLPRLYDWGYSEKVSDLEIAIQNSEGEHRKGSVIAAMLIDYYSNNAMQSTGWMFTISKIIPLLKEYHLEIYIKELFYKPCFGAREEHLDPSFVDQTKLKIGYSDSIFTLDIKPGLIQKQKKSSFWKKVKPIFKRRTNGQPEDLQLTNLRVVPLPDFTVYPKGNNNYQKPPNWKIPFLLLKVIFIPKGYTVQKDEQRSPFLRFIRHDENDEYYDNPAMEACINFKWKSARNHFILQIILYMLYALSFGLLTGVVGVFKAGVLFYILVIIFYYLGYYLLAKEVIQLHYDKWKYFTFYHIVDFLSRAAPLASYTAFLITKLRSGINNDNPKFSDLKNLGLDAIGLERSNLCTLYQHDRKYNAWSINIHHIYGSCDSWIWSLYVNPELINLTPSGQSFDIVNTTSNTSIPDLRIVESYDLDSTSDNYYRKFGNSIIAVYFWMLGRWDQMEMWDFWPITVLSITASILLVIIMQNMLIAFMTGVFDETKSNVKQAVLKFRADVIADYEMIDKPFGNDKGNPRYIYYVGRSEVQEEWLAKSERQRQAHKSLLAEDVHSHKFDDNNYINDDKGNIEHHSRGDKSMTSLGDELFNVEGFKGTRASESGKIQNFEFKVEPESDDNENENNKINILEKKIDMLSIDVTNRINVMEENLKELLKLMKEGKQS
ncbi:18742_t:CDS:2, partial [Funneliformis geosporum]